MRKVKAFKYKLWTLAVSSIQKYMDNRLMCILEPGCWAYLSLFHSVFFLLVTLLLREAYTLGVTKYMADPNDEF